MSRLSWHEGGRSKTHPWTFKMNSGIQQSFAQWFKETEDKWFQETLEEISEFVPRFLAELGRQRAAEVLRGRERIRGPASAPGGPWHVTPARRPGYDSCPCRRMADGDFSGRPPQGFGSPGKSQTGDSMAQSIPSSITSGPQFSAT